MFKQFYFCFFFMMGIYILMGNSVYGATVNFGKPGLLNCPLDEIPEIRGSDQVARSGGGFYARRKGGHLHGALDLNSTEGANVYAVRGGNIITSAKWPEMGNTIIIDHENGDYTIYGHLQSRYKNVGDRVFTGTIIGSVGYTGNAKKLRKYNLPAHLHFAVIRAGNPDINGDYVIRQMKNWAGFWANEVGAEAMGPINPQLLLNKQLTCWSNPQAEDIKSSENIIGIHDISPSDSYLVTTNSEVISFSTILPSTCKYSLTSTEYFSMPHSFSTGNGLDHSVTLAGFVSNSSYTYYIRCAIIDTADTIIKFSSGNIIHSLPFDTTVGF